jgi:hypothetical protein
MRHPSRAAVACLFLFASAVAPALAASDEIDLPEGEAWLHEPSGFKFPADVGTFTRLGASRFDEEGRNVSVTYGDRALKVLVTTFVYPNTPDMSLASHFEQVKRELRKANANARVLAEGPWTLEQGKRKLTGRRAAFSFNIDVGGGKKQEVVSEVYLLRLGDQFLKFRVTCPQEKYEAAADRVGRFVKSLEVPEALAAKPVPAK